MMARKRSAKKPTWITVTEAKAKLGELVQRARRGDVVIITWHGEPVARLVAYRKDARNTEDWAQRY